MTTQRGFTTDQLDTLNKWCKGHLSVNLITDKVLGKVTDTHDSEVYIASHVKLANRLKRIAKSNKIEYITFLNDAIGNHVSYKLKGETSDSFSFNSGEILWSAAVIKKFCREAWSSIENMSLRRTIV